jgi:hypothetical protein
MNAAFITGRNRRKKNKTRGGKDRQPPFINDALRGSRKEHTLSQFTTGQIFPVDGGYTVQ